MPELPEVETMLRGIARSVGSAISEVRYPRCSLRPIQVLPDRRGFRRRVRGRIIQAASRLGKRIVLQLDGGDRVVIEPRMTGLVLPADPPERRHLRLVLELNGGPVSQILFWDQRGLGLVQVVTADQFARRYGPERLGPDALAIRPAVLRTRLGSSRRAIKVALLDQRAVSGIGNLYASEILYHAAIHPAAPCTSLTPREWSRLHASLRRVLTAAVRAEGSTLGDGTYRIGRDRPGGYQEFHRVYQRGGRPCPRCQMPIVRIVQAQRSTFFCPVCQVAGGKS